MRFHLIGLLALPLASCFPAPQVAKPEKETLRPPDPVSAAIGESVSKPEAPVVAISPARIRNREISGVLFEGVEFDSRTHRMRVVDQAGGPGSRFADAEAAGSSLGGIAAVNGGFFTPEGDPLGLVSADGAVRGSWNTGSSLGSGVWYDDSAAGTAIVRRTRISRTSALTMNQLVQAGPMLVEGSQAVGGLDAAKASPRTVIAWDGGSRWWIGRSSACSLADAARALASGSPAGWNVRQALNLDGGRSADLWISGSVQGGPLTRRPFWNKPVRNFLVVTVR